MKKVLVTGCSGYIGQHLCRLLSPTYEVDGLDIKDPSDKSHIKRFFKSDIRDTVNLPREKYDAVIHLAALIQVSESVKKPTAYYDTNINGTINIIKYTNYNNFIFASTGAAEQPSNPYSISKLACENIINENLIKDFTIFRFYNVIGSAGYSPTNPDGLFYNLLLAKKNGIFNLFGNDYNTPDGTAIRDFVHVMEICCSIEQAIEKPANGIENLGHGKGYSVLEIVEKFKEVNDCDFTINFLPRRNGDLEKSVLNKTSSYMKNFFKFEELIKLD